MRRPHPVGAAAPTGRGALRRAVAERPPAERAGLVLAAVRGHVAAVLGHASGDSIAPDRAFQDLGFDSLGAVELRDRLGAATGLDLPATLAFDRPDAAALTAHLLGLLEPAAADPVVAALAELDRLTAGLAAIGADVPGRARVGARLDALVRGWHAAAAPTDAGAADAAGAADPQVLRAAPRLPDDEELFRALDDELEAR